MQRDTRHLVDDVETLWLLRNRVAHLEPLIRPGMVQNGLDAITRVLADIEPAVSPWHEAQSRVSAVLSKRPVTA